MLIFSQNGHKDKNGHILEGPGTSKYTEIIENPRRRSGFAHEGRRFTTFEASKYIEILENPGCRFTTFAFLKRLMTSYF